MRTFAYTALFAVAVVGSANCTETDEQGTDDALDETSETTSEVRTGDIWVHLDSNDGVNNATLSVLNNASTRCPSGRTSKACFATKLILPADCNWECQDGLLSRRGEGVLHGRFVGRNFVVDVGYDTFSLGMGTTSVYRLSASTTCAQDPCPTAISRQKLNSSARPDAVTGLDFSRATDPVAACIKACFGLTACGALKRRNQRATRNW
jgi:hypothetical protein